MHLIWYNSLTKLYEYGSSLDFKLLRKNFGLKDSLTILMEFTENDETLANKIIKELNIAKVELMSVIY